MSLVLDHAARPAAAGLGARLGALGWFSTSLGLHVGVVALFLTTAVEPAALVSSGGGGEEMSTVEAVLAQAVFPEVEPPQPEEQPLVEAPEVETPEPVVVAKKVERKKPEKQKPEKKKPVQARKAEKKPDAKKKPAKAQTEARAASKAAGAGGAATAGTGGKDKVSKASAGKAKSALNQWGASIRSKIDRRKSYPSAAGGASGTVRLALTVSRSGALLGASVAGSSGVAALDKAALAAVRKAGKFPSAPQALDKASYSFTVALRFNR